MSDTPSVAVESSSDTPARPGQLLAQARERRNQSIGDIAQQLKLSPSQIEALEADNYAKLPGPIFVRGFIRNYARLVDLDGDALVSGLMVDQTVSSAGAAVPHSDNIPFPENHKRRWPVFLGAFLIVIGIVLIFDYMISPASAPVRDVSVTAAPVILPAVQSSAVVTEPMIQPLASPLPQAQSAPAVAEPMAQSSQPAINMPSTASSSSASAPGSRNLQLIFSADSWVEVRDRNDRVVFSQLNRAGTTEQVQGRAPLNVVIGNARGVRLLYEGRPFDLTPHTRVEVARFTLE